MDEYERYEADCKKIRKYNKKLLQDFEVWLEASKLKETTIRRHVENIDFYINDFLLYEDAIKAKDGASEIGMFLGYWFIKKAMWASPAYIKSNAGSLKKFYTFLVDIKQIEKQELDDLKTRIKEDMPEWIATMNRYDDPSITDMEDVWGL
ncbi:MAG: recombinase [Pseudomonadota bacterium]